MPPAARQWQLAGVATFSASKAFAVGQGMVARFNGSGWRQAVTTSAALYAIVRTTSSTAWAVGTTNPDSGLSGAAVFHYDGSRWDRVLAAQRADSWSGFSGVAATSDGNVWAVGSSEARTASATAQALAEHWNGRRWRIVATPPGMTGLLAASMTRKGHLYVLGYAGSTPLILRRVGTGWQSLRLPKLPGTDGTVSAVLARSDSDVWVAGTYERLSDGFTHGAVVDHWNGSSFSRVWVQQPKTWDSSEISQITATGDQIYLAGSVFLEDPTYDSSQAEVWRLTRYGFAVMQTPSLYTSQMSGISARGNTVMAVGSDASGAIAERLMLGH